MEKFLIFAGLVLGLAFLVVVHKGCEIQCVRWSKSVELAKLCRAGGQ